MIIVLSGIGRALHSDVSCHRQLGVDVLTFFCVVLWCVLSNYSFYDIVWSNCTFL